MEQHSHAGHLPTSGRALVISAWLTGVYFVIDLAVGLWTGSIAVLAHSFHALSAVGGVPYALVNKDALLGMVLLMICIALRQIGSPIHLTAALKSSHGIDAHDHHINLPHDTKRSHQ